MLSQILVLIGNCATACGGEGIEFGKTASSLTEAKLVGTAKLLPAGATTLIGDSRLSIRVL